MKAKNIFLRVFKLVLLVFFVGNTGIVQGIYTWSLERKKSQLQREEVWKIEEEANKKFGNYCTVIVENAKKLSEHGLYKPEDYFRDWKNIMQFLADSVDPSMVRYTETFFVNDLVLAREKSYRMIGFHQYGNYVEMTKTASEKTYPEIEKLRQEIGKKRPDTGPSLTSTFFFVFRFLTWLFKFWLTSLPVAFLLMLYWHFRWRRRITRVKQLFIDTLLFPKLLVMRMFDAVLDRYTEAELVARGKIKREQIYDYDKNGRQYCSDTHVHVDADFTSIREDIRELMWNPTELKAYLDANFGVRKISLATALLILISVRIGIAAEVPSVLVGEMSTHATLVTDDDVGDPPDDHPDDEHIEFCEYWVKESILFSCISFTT